MLDILTEDASKCCHRAWERAALSGMINTDTADRFECPNCGCEYRPRIEGALRSWEFVAAAELWR